VAVTTGVGRDPASILKNNGPQALSDLLSMARPAAEVLLELHLIKWPDRLENAEAAIACLRETANMIAKAQPQDTATLAARLSRETRLALVTVTAELTAAVSSFTPAQMPRTHHRTACAPAPVSPGERRQTSSTPELRR
jgi:DNA primase